jgi:hypothetical protein
MTGLGIWLCAIAAYATFIGWYYNWRRPLSAAEADQAIDRLLVVDPDAGSRNDLETLRRFLAADDGRQFFMLNLVRLADGLVADPETGAMTPARALMQRYTNVFLPALLRRGGHPVFAARKVGGYVDAWGAPADPGWTLVGYVRYRSRRDLVALVCDPRFPGAHAFKAAAMPITFSFPTQPFLLTFASPGVMVGVLIALIAALVHLQK